MKIHSNLSWWIGAALSIGIIAAAQAQQQGAARAGSRGSAARTYPNASSIGDAYFSIDPESRRVVTIADEDTTKYISMVLSNLDRPKPQVLIKVVFLEVVHNNSSDIGIEGGWEKSIGNDMSANAAHAFGMSAINQVIPTGTNTAPVNMFNQPVQGFAPTPPGAGLYQILGQDFQVTLRAIAQAGNARVLSRPSILARNNQPATITVGQSVPLITSVRYDNFGNAINSVQYQDVGVILRVTPFITPDNMVEMIVSPQISSIDNTVSIPISTGVSAPVIAVRSADTVAVTPDGQTVIIGGLISNSKSSNESKIPLLGDIPLLGNLFKRRANADAKTELLIFLTPHIVQAPTQLAAVTETEQRKSPLYQSLSEKELNHFLDTMPPPSTPKKRSKK
jgi:general secretion pathway protein D